MELASVDGLGSDREFWNPRIEVMSREELKALQFKKLKKQLKYNYENSIFYKRSFDNAGIKPGDIRSWDDFALVPIMTKDDQRKCQEESLERFGHPYGVLACAPMHNIIRNSATSGTTGTPTLYTLTRHDVQVIRELSARKFWRMGLRPGDRVLHAMALSMFTGGVPVCDTLQEYGVCVIPVGSESGIRRVLQFIDLCKPHYIRCTPSTAEHLLRKCPEILGKEATALGLKGMLVSGESGGGVLEVRKRIKDGFGLQYLFDNIGGSHVFQAYSCPETADSLDYKGMHLVSEDYCILELLDPVTKKPVELTEGATGEMIYTYIDWEGTPLLRFRLGDMLTVSFKPCECRDPRMRFNIIGRADDMLIVKGINLYPEALKKAVLAFVPRVTGEVRILLDAPGPKVEPPLKIQVESGQGVSKADLALLDREMKDQIRSLLRINPDIEFVPPNTFELKEQKTKLVIKRYEQRAEPKTATPIREEPKAKTPRSISYGDVTMDADKLDIKQIVREHYDLIGVHEFPFFCIGRQGGRTAVEILTRALIAEGKSVYLGQNLGRRSLGTNTMVVRFGNNGSIPPGMSVSHPSGMMFMHETLVWPDHAGLDYSQIRRPEFVKAFRSGILMVCTSKAPEDVDYPIDFEGTIATVDAEAVFSEKLSIQPAPSGITALGLFVAATGDLVSIEAIKEATLGYERLSKRVRELNAECIQVAYDRTRVLRNAKIKGRFSTEEFNTIAGRQPSSEFITALEKSASTSWREFLPVCDVGKCVCTECIAAYSCPEGVIIWRDEEFSLDYDFCKGCGTCAQECPENAMTMELAETVLSNIAKGRQGQLSVSGGH